METDLLRNELLDRQADLAEYEFFFRNMNFGLGLEDTVKKHLEKKAKIRVFDIGCGIGNALAGLKRIFGSRVYSVGLDALPATVDGIDEFIQGNALEEKFPNSCDIIVSFRAMHEFGNTEKIIEKVCKALSLSGQAFLSVRCQGIFEGKIQNLGKIEVKDIKFLLEILEKGKVSNTRVQGNFVPLTIEDFSGLGQKKNKNKQKQYIAGINLLLEKQ